MSELTKYTPEEFLEEEDDNNTATSLREIASSEIGFIKQHKNEETALKAQIKLLQNELKALESERKEAEKHLIGVMNSHGQKSISFYGIRFTVKNNPGKIVVEDASQVPREFLREVTESLVDKKAVKAFYDEWKVLPPGTKFSKTQSLLIGEDNE